MSAAAAIRELLADVQAELLEFTSRSGGRWQGHAMGDGEKLDIGNLEAEFAVAFAADVICDIASNRD